MTHLLQPLLNFLKFRIRRPAPLSCRPPVAHPLRDWPLLVGGAAAAAILLLAGAALLYVFAPWAREPASAAAESVGLDAQKLNATLAHHALLASEHAQLLAAPPVVIDPAK